MPPLLPVSDILPDLISAIAAHGRAVLQAPPGAGKTTLVPLALLQAGLSPGRILMLEPRRLATRAAAERMAHLLEQKVGQTVGYRMRGQARVSAQTQIEVVTEGILTRMIQSDPALTGIGAVIFDEFHERSLHADLGLALCLEVREALRCDLLLLVMSATLDTGPVAELLGGAPVLRSEGYSYPVETRWPDRPRHPAIGLEPAMADLVETALVESVGGVLVFLPGEREIRRVENLLRPRIDADVRLFPLYGALDFKTQQAAVRPLAEGRKVVLATSIAETSLTIEDIRVVVDSGLARRARFDPGSGMSRLVTERASRAETTQRRGRAGRTAAGTCYRLWTQGEQGGMAPFAPAEIEIADLAPLVLETALWGARDPGELGFLTRPNAGAVAGAKQLLQRLAALDDAGALTAQGRKMAAMPIHPRLAHMVLQGGQDAPKLAALLSEPDLFARETGPRTADLAQRLAALDDPQAFEKNTTHRINRTVLARVGSTIARLPPVGPQRRSVGEMAALAFPDRIGLRRKGPAPRYVLAAGKGAAFDVAEALGQQRLIVACNLDGDRKEARIRLAVALSETELRAVFAGQIDTSETCLWSPRDQKVLARRQEMFGALVLQDRPWKDCPPDAIARALMGGIREQGLESLAFSATATALIDRVEWARGKGADLPDFSIKGLTDDLEIWLAPFLGKTRSLPEIAPAALLGALDTRLGRPARQLLNKLAPTHYQTPGARGVRVDYAAGQPRIAVRLQEMFGVVRHPVIGPEHTPLEIDLLSPAGRLLQRTADLPGFWQGSYRDVRKDMRGRYPKHAWPEDPARAVPVNRAGPRKA